MELLVPSLRSVPPVLPPSLATCDPSDTQRLSFTHPIPSHTMHQHPRQAPRASSPAAAQSNPTRTNNPREGGTPAHHARPVPSTAAQHDAVKKLDQILQVRKQASPCPPVEGGPFLVAPWPFLVLLTALANVVLFCRTSTSNPPPSSSHLEYRCTIPARPEAQRQVNGCVATISGDLAPLKGGGKADSSIL